MTFSVPRYIASWLNRTPLYSPALQDRSSSLAAERPQVVVQPLECLSTVAPHSDATLASIFSFLPEQLVKETSAQVAAGVLSGMIAAPRYCKMASELVGKRLPLSREIVCQKGLSNGLTSFIVPLYDGLLEALGKKHWPCAATQAALGAAIAETAITFRAERRALHSLTGKAMAPLFLCFLLVARAAAPWHISGESRAYAQAQQLEALSASAVGIAAGLTTALATTPIQNFLFAHAYQGDIRKTVQFFSQKPSRAFSGMHHRAITFAYFIIGMMAADALSRPSAGA